MIRFFTALFLLLFFGCNTGIKTRELLFRNNEFAIYKLKRENLKLKNPTILPPSFAHPIDISEDKILDVMGNLKFKQESSYGNLFSYVFDEKEIREFAGDLTDGLRLLKPNEILLIVSKYNPQKSVVSHYVRTGLYLWADETSFHLLFGEIKVELDFEDQGNYFDWSKISDIAFENTPESDFILPDQSFSFKQVDGFKNKRWLVFEKRNLSKLRFEKRKIPDTSVETSVKADLINDKRKIKPDDDSLLND